MARGKLMFKESDVKRAIRAATAAGIEIARIEVDKNGKIAIIVGKPEERPAKGEKYEWDVA